MARIVSRPRAASNSEGLYEFLADRERERLARWDDPVLAALRFPDSHQEYAFPFPRHRIEERVNALRSGRPVRLTFHDLPEWAQVKLGRRRLAGHRVAVYPDDRVVSVPTHAGEELDDWAELWGRPWHWGLSEVVAAMSDRDFEFAREYWVSIGVNHDLVV